MNPWYENSFGDDYILVYRHRDQKGANEEVHAMMSWLQPQLGASVLDLCCGMGRHSIAMHELGFKVTGVDLSRVLLEEAQKKAGSKSISFVQGDMRQVPLYQPFDVIVNLFTSFGYFEQEEENIRVLQEMYRLLKPDGKFLIDYLNPVYVEKNLVPESVRQQNELTIREKRWVEQGFVCKRITIEQTSQRTRTYDEKVKLYEYPYFLDMLSQAGLTLQRVVGDYDGHAYQRETSKRMILIGHK